MGVLSNSTQQTALVKSVEAFYLRPGTSNSHICRNDDTTLEVTEDPKENSSWRNQNSLNN